MILLLIIVIYECFKMCLGIEINSLLAKKKQKQKKTRY